MPEAHAAAAWMHELLQTKQPVTWLFTGDSITQGAVYTSGWRDYTQLFKERLFEIGRAEDVLINTAVSGWSLEQFTPRIEDRVLRHRPDAVFIKFATNDSVAGAAGLARFRELYLQAIQQIRAAGIRRICLQTSPPMHPIDPQAYVQQGQYTDDAARQAAVGRLRNVLAFLERYVQATRDVAQQENLPLVDHFAAWHAIKSSRGPLLDGGFHPNEYGHRLMARTLFKTLGLWDAKSPTCRLFSPADVGV